MWRGISLRTFALLLLGPMVLDTLIICFLFWTNVESARMGILPKQQLLIALVYAAFYAVSAHYSGRWLTQRRALWMVLIAAPAMALVCQVVVAAPDFRVFLVGAAVVGLAGGHYFVPFQFAMGDVRPFRTLAWTIAFYNVSWGCGNTFGPVLARGMEGGRLPISAGDGFVMLVCVLAVAHTLLVLQSRSAPRRPAEQPSMTVAVRSTPTLRMAGWIAAGTVCAIMSALGNVLWPQLGVARGLSDRSMALYMLVLSAPIPVCALLWARLRRRLDRPHLMLALLVLGAGSIMAIPLTASAWGLALAMTGVGVAGSGLYYHGIYYSNGDPGSSGRSVSVYERTVGVGSFAGPLVAGLLAWNDQASLRPYVACGLAMLAAAVVVAVIWARRPAVVT